MTPQRIELVAVGKSQAYWATEPRVIAITRGSPFIASSNTPHSGRRQLKTERYRKNLAWARAETRRNWWGMTRYTSSARAHALAYIVMRRGSRRFAWQHNARAREAAGPLGSIDKTDMPRSRSEKNVCGRASNALRKCRLEI